MTRLLPIWPGPRMPLNTREGVAEAPIEPGARLLCEPCDIGPREKLWRLTVPWKPLPFEVPEILTVSPFSKASATLTSLPTWSSPASSRNSARRFSGGASAVLRWPSSPLVRRFSVAVAERQLHGVVAVALAGA